MTDGPTLFDGPPDPPPDAPAPRRKPTIQERFEAFDAANPHVYAIFKAYAIEMLEAGRTRYSADCILHRVRWHFDVQTTGEGGFKINDHFSSRFGRKLAAEDPRFADFFEFRELHAA